MSDIVLSAKDLRKAFGGVVAVDGVSFAIEKGTVTALIGPNGSGKTTLLNLLTGFLSRDGGEIHFCGKGIGTMSPHQIVRLGISRTFQEMRLLGRLSALENVLLARPNRKSELLRDVLFSNSTRREEARQHQRALSVLDFVGLREMAEELAGNLSYGEQKLLSLACCLGTEGRLLFLDEPVAGVSPETSDRIAAVLLGLKAEEKTVVLIEHDIETVRKVADWVLVMDHGRLIASGLKDEVLGRAEIVEAYLT